MLPAAYYLPPSCELNKMADKNEAPLLEMHDITKSFPGVRALDGVTFDLYAGEIHALVGENGAGKSTLMKVLGGVYPAGNYGGEVVLNGEARRFSSVRDAEDAGIAVIYQELSLVKEMTIGENIFLGREPRRFGIILWDELYSRASRLLKELHLGLDPRTPVGHLGIGQQQLVVEPVLGTLPAQIDARVIVQHRDIRRRSQPDADELTQVL